jgi:hypothetical protein
LTVAERYYVRRIGAAVLVVPAGDPDTTTIAEAAELLEPYVADLQPLGDPVVLGQAVEAGYYVPELEARADAVEP